MFKCSSCGFDNPIESVFCRECGSELEIEFVKSKNFKKKKSKAIPFLKNVISSLVLLFVFLILAGLFWSTGFRTPYELTANQKKNIDARYETFNTKILENKTSGYSLSLNASELSYLYNKDLLSSSSNSENSETVTNVGFNITEDKKITSIMKSTFLGFIPVRLQFTGNFEVIKTMKDEVENIEIKYNIDNVKLGHIPLCITAIEEMFVNRYKYIFKAKKIATLVDSIGSLSIDQDSKLTIIQK